jgi:cellulose synthase/poly-beta-1,6-N-acetylglucosamine synthase-like glycosyltransferase
LLVAHTYVLYPCVLFVVYALRQARADLRYLTRRSERRRRGLDERELPAVTFIVPAYNEERHLKDKLSNLRELDYPKDRLQVVIVSDGSTDQTNAILSEVHDSFIETVLRPERSGKWGALNEGVRRARHDILIMSDASTLFEPAAIRYLVRHFRDQGVGVVCGALGFHGGDEHKQTEGVYWRYETMLRLMEARVGATLTASGAIYAVRRSCYRPLTADDIIDDFVVPLRARALGFRVVFDPEAEALEFAGDTVKDEFTRRVRIAVGSFRALRELSRVRMDLMAAFSFFSHKVLRWVLPFLLIGAFASNLFLLASPFYRATLFVQAAVYLWATLGFVLRERARRVPLAMLCYYLMAINVAYLVGFFRFVGGRRDAAWQRVS